MSKLAWKNLRLGIDPGTLYTRIYGEGQSIQLSEPSVAATDYRTGEVVAVGTEAAILLRSRGGDLRETRPFVNGEIHDYEAARTLLQVMLDKVQKNKVAKPEVCLAVPRMVTAVQKRTWLDALRYAGARECVLIDRAAAAWLAEGESVTGPKAHAAADLGVGMTLAVMASGGYLASGYEPLAGGNLTMALTEFLEEKYQVMIDMPTIRDIQRDVAVAVADAGERSRVCVARSRRDGTEVTFTVTSGEIYPVVCRVAERIAKAWQSLLRKIGPQAQADIEEEGIFITGGTSLLAGLDLYLHAQLGLVVNHAQDPFDTVARGAVMALAKRKDCVYLLEGAADPYGRNG